MNLDEPHWLEWLRDCASDARGRERSGLHEDSLAIMTGQDKRALAAIAACWQLYAAADEQGAEAAMRAAARLLDGMQRSVWHIARALIAFAMDWSDMDRLWTEVQLRRSVVAAVRHTLAVRD